MGSDITDPSSENDEAAELRDDSADARDQAARARDEAAAERDERSVSRDATVRENRRAERSRVASAVREEEPKREAPDDFGALRDFLDRLQEYQVAVAADRRAAAEDREAAAEDRRAAARDRELAAWARQQREVEAAEGWPDVDAPVPGEKPEVGAPGGGEGHGGRSPTASGTELNIALRIATARESEALESAQRAAELAGQVADSERRVAATLRELDSRQDAVASARRLALSEEATKGAALALERGGRLRDLATSAAQHLEAATLRTLLRHGATAFNELSRAERSIASAMALLADHESGRQSDEHRRQAEEARAAADLALERAEELHRLEMAVHHEHPDAQKPRP